MIVKIHIEIQQNFIFYVLIVFFFLVWALTRESFPALSYCQWQLRGTDAVGEPADDGGCPEI